MNFKTRESSNEGEHFLKTLLTFSGLKLVKNKKVYQETKSYLGIKVSFYIEIWKDYKNQSLKLYTEHYKTYCHIAVNHIAEILQ